MKKKKKKPKRFREWFLEKCKLPFAQATVLRHEAPPYTIQADQNRYLIFVNRMFVNIDRAKARYAGRIGFLTSKKRQPPDSFFLSFFLSFFRPRWMDLNHVSSFWNPSLQKNDCFRDFFEDWSISSNTFKLIRIVRF